METEEKITEEVKPNKKSHRFLWGLIAGVLIGVLSFRACMLFQVQYQFKNIDSVSKKIDVIANLIHNEYLYDVNDKELTDYIYKGMVASLNDPYSEYLTKEEFEEFKVDVYGTLCGIGATLQQNLDTMEVIVQKPFRDSPAQKAGILAGDSIVSVDDTYFAKDMELSEYVLHIRGEEGTEVKLHIKRGEEEFDVVAVRAQVYSETVEYELRDENIGYIKIDQFALKTADEMEAAIEDLKSMGAKSLVIDLRNNGGGMVDTCVQMLDYILPEGTVVYTMDKNEKRQDHTSKASSVVKMPMAVLVNENTASASEIFTGAIRDYDWGVIVGTKTFGKGIVQTQIPLRDGSVVKLTTMQYFTPDGEAIHKVGITPDIEVEDDLNTPEDEVYEAAVKAILE